jgi:hypothetical protein
VARGQRPDPRSVTGITYDRMRRLAEWAVSLRPLESMMSKKAVMVLVLFAISGIVPAMASWGSCADMPCCRHAVSIEIETGCNAPGTCLKESKPLPPTQMTAQRNVITVVLTSVRIEAATPVQRTLPRHASPPLPIADRLSALSTLLI